MFEIPCKYKAMSRHEFCKYIKKSIHESIIQKSWMNWNRNKYRTENLSVKFCSKILIKMNFSRVDQAYNIAYDYFVQLYFYIGWMLTHKALFYLLLHNKDRLIELNKIPSSTPNLLLTIEYKVTISHWIHNWQCHKQSENLKNTQLNYARKLFANTSCTNQCKMFWKANLPESSGYPLIIQFWSDNIQQLISKDYDSYRIVWLYVSKPPKPFYVLGTMISRLLYSLFHLLACKRM
jgi:hypothetical protein